MTEKYLRYEVNDGPLIREIVVNEAEQNSTSTPTGFENLEKAIDRELKQVDQIFITETFRMINQQSPPKEFPERRMSRLARTFGEDAIRKLQNLRVAVIGAGRLGGPIIEELSAKGASLIIVDKDDLEEENLPYLPGEANDFLGNPKVDFWASYCSGRYSHQEVIPAYGDAGEEEILNVIKGTDLLVIAIDEAFGRFLLNLLGVQYRIPILEMGTATEGEWTDEFSWYGRIRFLIPGVDGCLHCVEGLPLEVVSEETKTQLESQMLGEEDRTGASYKPVGHLSSQLSQTAMTKILGWLAGRKVQSVTEIRFQDDELEILESNGDPLGDCPVCDPGGLLGEADSQPLPSSQKNLVNVGRRR